MTGSLPVSLTSNGQKPKGAIGALYQLKGFTKLGDLKLTNGWVIGKEYGNLAHGYCHTSHVAQSKTVDRVFVAQSAASLGASSAEQFYVSVSRARDSVLIYTDDKARLVEAIQSSGARMTAYELLKLPTVTNTSDPFDSILRAEESIRPKERFSVEPAAQKATQSQESNNVQSARPARDSRNDFDQRID